MSSPTAATASAPPIIWQAKWIGRPDKPLNNWRRPTLPAPLLRREFELDQPATQARLAVCGLGYYELCLDGEKVGDHVLSPTVSQYDQRAFYEVYELEGGLGRGLHAIGVILGEGWYNCSTQETWHFDKAPWRDRPKLLLQLELTLADGSERRIVTGPGWTAGEGPIRFNALRNGEFYDANYQTPGWDAPGFDDGAWPQAKIVAGPGGMLEPMPGPPCKVIQTRTPVDCWSIEPGAAIYDMGQGFAGWAQLHLSMTAGQTVELQYADQLNDQRNLDMTDTERFIYSGQAQTDRYTAARDGPQSWEPRFTYHGFRYVRVSGLEGEPGPDDLRGRVVSTAMDTAGRFACSDDRLNQLQEATRWSYLSNFVGIPTDCPHREKNGWTGDAQIAVETGLMNFDAGRAYLPWLLALRDVQRPSGQIPGIAPSAGYGYNWGSGPAWDAALTVVPWMIYLYTGRTEAMQRLYPAMRRYAGFCDTMATGGIVYHGLPDWCPPKGLSVAPVALTSTAYYFKTLSLVSRCAAALGRDDDARAYNDQAQQVRAAFNRTFYRGDGLYAEGELTALASPVYHGLAEPDEIPRIVEQLARGVEAAEGAAQFGIMGAKYVPRVLAEHGRPDLALRLLTQPRYPGWNWWLEQGATTLWEHWNGRASQNHIMFGDVSAWMFHYLAGLGPDPAHPGFRPATIRPWFAPSIDWVRAEHHTPRGWLRCRWERTHDHIQIDLEIPDGVEADLAPFGYEAGAEEAAGPLAAGEHRLTLPAPLAPDPQAAEASPTRA